MQYINTFTEIKKLTEELWEKKTLAEIYGYQFQPKTKWKPGLSDGEIAAFEKAAGFEFPEILRDYYTVMNGIDKESVNIYGNNGYAYTYSKMLYSYPEDIKLLEDLTQMIYDENYIEKDHIGERNISRIFPVYTHCFLLIDHPAHPILSMYGEEIMYHSNNLADLLYGELAKRNELRRSLETGHGWIEG
jgi:hypothetical protein